MFVNDNIYRNQVDGARRLLLLALGVFCSPNGRENNRRQVGNEWGLSLYGCIGGTVHNTVTVVSHLRYTYRNTISHLRLIPLLVFKFSTYHCFTIVTFTFTILY